MSFVTSWNTNDGPTDEPMRPVIRRRAGTRAFRMAEDTITTGTDETVISMPVSPPPRIDEFEEREAERERLDALRGELRRQEERMAGVATPLSMQQFVLRGHIVSEDDFRWFDSMNAARRILQLMPLGPRQTMRSTWNDMPLEARNESDVIVLAALVSGPGIVSNGAQWVYIPTVQPAPNGVRARALRRTPEWKSQMTWLKRQK